MITDKDVQKLKSVFATKEDLVQFATKEDLSKLATKDSVEDVSLRLKSMEIDMKEIKETVTRLDERDLADSNAFKSIAVDHDLRIGRIEKILKIPKTAH